jgi:hypothetical protein
MANGRRAKQLRRKAEHTLHEWYLSLLEEDQREGLTLPMSLEYTPKVSYWCEKHERTTKDGKEYVSIQAHVSTNTQRWFTLQEKKHYG